MSTKRPKRIVVVRIPFRYFLFFKGWVHVPVEQYQDLDSSLWVIEDRCVAHLRSIIELTNNPKIGRRINDRLGISAKEKLIHNYGN